MDKKPTSPPKQAGKEIGKSGTLVFGGMIVGEDYNRELSGHLLVRKVEVMRRSSSTVRSTLLVVKLPLLSAPWNMQPAKGPDGKVTPEDEKISKFVERELFHRNVNFFDFMRQGITCFDFGYSVFEKVFGMTDHEGQTRIGLDKLGFRKQSSVFKWETKEGQPGITQIIGNGDSFSIPREKLIVFTNEKEGDNDEGMSLLRFAFKDWDMLDKLTIVNAIALERMGVGVPIVSAKDGETPGPNDEEKAEEVLRNFRANEESFMKIPSTMTVEMLDMKSNNTKDIIPTLNYHDRRVAQAVLAGFLEIGGHSGSGSQGLSKDLTSLFMKSEEAAAKTFQSTVNEQLIRQLCDLNFSNLPNGYPSLEFGSISDDDLVELANALGTLAEKGLVTPDLDLEGHLRDKYKLPTMSTEAQDAYKKKQEMALNPPQPTVNPDGTPIAKIDDKTLKTPSKPGKPNPKDIKAAAIDDLRRTRGTVLDVLLG